jgi:chromosome segregation ATPase
MDERKKQINELEQHKREQIVSLDALLTRLGETLMGRADAVARNDDSAWGDLSLFRRLQNDIAGSETAIQAVEEQIRRFRELDENIEAKEREDGAGVKELAVVYGRLGKLLLDAASKTELSSDAMSAEEDGGNYAYFCAPYREQADALLTKVFSLEERLAGVEGKESGNVFTWVGKSAQGLVLRSFLTKAQENLEQLRRNVGERYSRRDGVKLIAGETNSAGAAFENGEIENLCAQAERRQAEARVLLQELAELKEERRSLSGSMNAEGGPLRQIQSLKNQIASARDELKTLYRRIGAEAAHTESKQNVNALITPDDTEALDNAERINRLIHDDETAIEKLQASLAIDEEKATIEKYRKMIQDKKDKIAQAEKNIMEFENNIKVAQASIAKLENLL